MRIHIIGSLLFAAGMLFLPVPSSAQFRASITIAPPALLVYEQPVCPGDGYLWTPGYWGWDDAYYWVPGDWVMPPEVGYLWTPGYWGWGSGAYMFNEGYWGTSIGFYGGINYGFGYFGRGYEGGRWDNGHFFYNTTVNNVNVSVVHNVYNTRVNVASASRVSYNGGNGGVNARATPQEEAAAHGNHVGPVAAQTQHAQAARSDPQQRSSANRTVPAAATTRANTPNTAVHPTELPAVEHPARPNTGNAKLDQRYQKQQDQLVAKQSQDRQRLQQTQDKEHQQLAKQGANEAKSQQLEQRHQQQTQQMQQGHSQQMQQMQQRQQPAGGGARGGRR